MKTPLTSGKFPLSGRGIALAVTLAILISIEPHEASAKGGMKMCCLSPVSRAEAAPITSSRTEPKTTETLGGCGGKRYRDLNTHRCRGPADFGN
jgi:hypothetical protein